MLYCNLSPVRLNIIFHISQMARFEKKVTEQHKMCVLILAATLSKTFLILRKTERDMI